MNDQVERSVLMVVHTRRPRAVSVSTELMASLARRGIGVWLPAADAAELSLPPGAAVHTAERAADVPQSCDLVIVVGGDGTILRAAEWARDRCIPLLGVNLGHVGFLAEVEPDDVAVLVAAVADRSYSVEARTTLDVEVVWDGRRSTGWALNEAAVEKIARERMLDLVLEIDGRPLSRWGCDGVIVATPTGSTAYAWSAGGPVVWPDVAAMVVVPLSAHALFARPLVVSPASRIAVELAAAGTPAVIWCDGRRSLEVPAGARVEVTASPVPLRFARLHAAGFTDRLVRKFDLPVAGWRGGPGSA